MGTFSAKLRVSKEDRPEGDGRSVPGLVVMVEEGESEVMGAHSIEGLGMAADPVQKKLIPTVMLALRLAKS